MLKITTIGENGVPRVLKLEGKLLEPWMGEFLHAWKAACVASDEVRLDLSGLSFADATGITVLQEIIRTGASITRTSPFVTQLLKEA